MSTQTARKLDQLPGQMRRYADWRNDQVLEPKRRAVQQGGLAGVSAMLRGQTAVKQPDPLVLRLQEQRQRLLLKMGFGQLRQHITEIKTVKMPDSNWLMTGALESFIYAGVGRAAVGHVEQRIRDRTPIPRSRALVLSGSNQS